MSKWSRTFHTAAAGRSHRSHRFRRCRSTAAAVAAVAALTLAGGCTDDDDGGSAGAEARGVLEVGADSESTCLFVEEDLPPEVEELPVVACDVEHTHEIYATVDYDGDDVYPGLDQLGSFAQTECLRRFESFVGISAFDSSLSYSWLVPSLSSWNDDNDREVLCTLSDSDGAPLVGTMDGSEQ